MAASEGYGEPKDLEAENERLKSENASLRRHLHECSLVYAHAPAVFMLVDRSFAILSLSDYARGFVREPLPGLIGRKCYEALLHETSVCEACPVEIAMTGGKVAERTKKEPAHMGGVRYIQQIAIPVVEGGVVNKVMEIAVDRTEAMVLHEQMEKDFLSTVEVLAQLIEIHDPQIAGHSVTVRETAGSLARAMGMKGQDLEDVTHAAILHDIGKIGIPRDILDKKGPLTSSELAKVVEHPGFGERALASIRRFTKAREYVLRHHERFDGSGYPDGLHGEGIPLGARILAVADAYAAMTADRSYRRALPAGEARRELERGAGSQFDPLVVRKFLTLLEEQDGNGKKRPTS